MPVVLFPYVLRKVLNFGCNQLSYAPFPPGHGGPAALGHFGKNAFVGKTLNGAVYLPFPPLEPC
eukprot:6042724-Lingulodinium_polyedra.AAC.1